MGVLTGHPLARVRLRLRRPRDVAYATAGRLSWDAYVARAAARHERTGIWLDPGHTIHAWEALTGLPGTLRALPVMLWVTCPLVEGIPGAR